MTTTQFDAAFAVIKKLQQAGYDAVIVGGAVRDTLLKLAVHDVDVATSALPEETKAVFSKTVDIGIEHGTVLVLDAGEPIEVTTFRTEGEYADHRRPDKVDFVTNLAEDLKRRDFTINAMAFRAKDDIVDLFGGRDDLAAQIVRAVGKAEERFREDALRMLRAVRFSAKLNFTVEAETLAAITTCASDLQYIAIERIKSEFDQIVRSHHPYKAFQLLVDTGLANYLPGTFEHVAQWQGFQTADTLTGWAFFSYVEGDETLVSQYRGSNKEKQFVKRVLAAVKQLAQPLSARTLFDFDESTWRAAVTIYNHVAAEQVDLDTLFAQKRALPIQHKGEVVVTGKHLLAWGGQKGGPWLAEALDELLTRIVSGEIANDEQHIKEWFNREWQREI